MKKLAGLLVLWIFVLAFAAQAGTGAPQGDPKPAPPSPTSQQETSATADYQNLIRRREADLIQYNQIVSGKRSERRREETFQKYYPHPKDWGPRFFEVYESNPGTVAGCLSLVWVVTHWRDSELDYKCRTILFKQYLRQTSLHEICKSLSFAKQPRAKQDLLYLYDHSPVEMVKAHACLALCEMALDRLQEQGGDELRITTAEYVRLLGARFAAIKMAGKSGAQWSSRFLVQLDHLSLGQKVLDWQGKDLEGNSYSLSDTRGRVVLLFFWKTNSRPARLALPHVRSLIHKYADDPFSVFGFSGDLDPGKALRWQKALQVKFPSWHEPSTEKEPGVWGVTSWPSFFVLGPKGRILAARTDWKSARRIVTEAMEKLHRELQEDTPAPSGEPQTEGGESGEEANREPGSKSKPKDSSNKKGSHVRVPLRVQSP